MRVTSKLFLLFFLLASPLLAQTGTGPLASGYFPSINESCPNSTANGSGSNIWITDTMTKVLETNTSPGTNCYQIIHGTQGEFVDAQVHVVVPGGGYSALSVSLSNFVQSSPSSYTIPAMATSNNTGALTESSGTVTVPSTLNPAVGSSPPPIIVNVTPTGYNGPCTVITTSPTSFTCTPASGATGLGNSTINGWTFIGDANVYRESYMDITTVTQTTSAYYGVTGYYPDWLVPAIDPYFGQLTNAWPVNVSGSSPQNTQSAWIDVYIPNAAPSGYYLGHVTVSNGATTLATIPVVIGVWQWPSSGHMPASATLKTQFAGGGGFSGWCDMVFGNTTDATCGAQPFAGGSGNTAGLIGSTMGQTELLDHRVSGFDGQFLTGTFTSATTDLYTGTVNPNYTTIIPGAAATSVTWSSGSYSGDYYTQQTWDTLFNVTNASTWGTIYPSYNYTCDEPTSSVMNSTCIPAATTAHGLTPAFPTLVPATYANVNGGTGGITGASGNAIDFWVVEQSAMYSPSGTSGGCGCSNLADYQAWLNRAGGNPDGITPQLWSYESCSSAGVCGNGSTPYTNYRLPNDNVDGKPSSNRAMEWMSFMNGQKGELTFATTCAWVGQECYNGSNQNSMGIDPWVSVYLFGNNGDGTLQNASTYSCNGSMSAPQTNCPYSVKHWVTPQAGGTLTYEIWVPSMRLKLKRDGFQDYEYLYYLSHNGYSSFVNTQISNWITDPNDYEYTGSGLQTARTNLGTTLHEITYPSGGQAATPTISPSSGTVTLTVTFSSTSGTVICYRQTTSPPATNGLGTGCTTGTQITGNSGTSCVASSTVCGDVSISSAGTYYAVAGSSSLSDSTVASGAYTSSSSHVGSVVGSGVLIGSGVKIQ